METFVILTDSGSDLRKELIAQYGINIVNLTVNIGDEEYDGIDKKIPTSELYDLMKKGQSPKTSQVSPEKAEKFFEKYLEQNLDIIHICLSGQISGTYNSCKIAALNLKDRYPERRIEVIDSLSASLGLGILVLLAAKQQKANKSYEEVVRFVEEKKHKICHVFTVSDLVYLQRGGRISKTEAVIGSLIGIKPVLSCDDGGYLVPIAKARGRKNSLISVFEQIKQTIDLTQENVVAISHGDCIDDVNFIAEKFKNELNIKDIVTGDLGPVIGSHAGPGTLAVFCVAKNRINKK